MKAARILPLLGAASACGSEPVMEVLPFVAPEPPPIGLQLHMTKVTIQPGEDVEYCTYFDLEPREVVEGRGGQFLLNDLVVNGVDPMADEIAVGRIDVRGAPGLHHVQILAIENDVEDVADKHIFECAVDLFGGPLTGDVDPLFFTARNDFGVAYDPGVARVLRRTKDKNDETKTRGPQLLYNFHYLNTTEKPIDAEVVVNLHTVDRQTVQHPVRAAWWNYLYFEAEVNQKSRVEAKGGFKVDVQLVGMTSHQHEMGTLFTYDLAGKEIYRSTNWDEPLYKVFEPGTVLRVGEKLGFTCEWFNRFTSPRYFGLQADDEMCTAVVEYYPADEAAAESLLEMQRMQAEQNMGGPFSGDVVTLEEFIGFPEDLLRELEMRPGDYLKILDQDILCGIAFNLRQMEEQYGRSPDILRSVQGLLEFLRDTCRL